MLKKHSVLMMTAFVLLASFLCTAPKSKASVLTQNPVTVTGTVVDEAGPVIGATVMEQGTLNGTMTGSDGTFSLRVSSPQSVIVITSIGYADQELAVGEKRNFEVHLATTSTALDEVVVIGYGTVQRKNFTGSVSTLKVADTPVAQLPMTNPMTALRGTTTGIEVGVEDGAGATPSLQIRGQKSVNGDQTPLIVMDGVIYSGAYRDIDPNIIQSISVLKDATSLAAYGSQAANGVIMITTKKGSTEKPVINFNTSIALSNIAMKPKLLSNKDYIRMTNLLSGYAEDTDPLSYFHEFAYEMYKNGTPTDAFDYSTRTGVLQNYSASVSGIKDKINYFLSGTYNKQKGIIIGDDYKRTVLNAKIQSDITDWLQIGGKISYSANDYSGATVTDLNQALKASPYGKYTRENGEPERFILGQGWDQVNPLWDVLSGTIDDEDKKQTVDMSGHVLIKVPWVEGLTYRINGSYRTRNDRINHFTHEGHEVDMYTDSGNSEERYSDVEIAKHLAAANGYNIRQNRVSWVMDNILNYTRSFGNHFVDATLVYTRDYNDFESRRMTGKDFSSLGNSNLGAYGLNYAGTQKIETPEYWKHTDIGYLARLNYAFRDTYHISFSFRRDGSSVFGQNRKWGNFPAIGLAWTVSNEPFMKGISDKVSYLKAKVSWGKNGNQTLSPYQTLSTISLGQPGNLSYTFGNSSTVSWGEVVSKLGNPDLGWETTESLNYGFELGLLQDRIRLEYDGYFSKTTNQIFERNIPVIINGLTKMDATMGQVNNWGMEINLTTQNIRTQELNWTTKLSFYLNRNKLVDLYGDGKDDVASSLFIGKSLGAIYGYKNIGIIQAKYDASGKPVYDESGNLVVCDEDAAYAAANGTKPGEAKFANLDGSEDNKITASDRTILGYNKPNFTMSLMNDISWKNFDLYFLLTGTFGGNDFCRYTNRFAYQTYDGSNAANMGLDHPWWTVENASNTYPKINYNNGNYTPVQSWAFVRLQDISLSYRFNRTLLEQYKIAGLKLYVSCQNLFTITNWDGGDPERRQTRNHFGYPLSRVFSFGVNLTF